MQREKLCEKEDEGRKERGKEREKDNTGRQRMERQNDFFFLNIGDMGGGGSKRERGRNKREGVKPVGNLDEIWY